MDIAGIINRAKNILLTPKNIWPLLATERAPHAQVLNSWVLPLAVLSSLAALIGYGIVGYSADGVRIVSMKSGFIHALLQLLTTIGGAYITALVINTLAEKFSSEKNLDQSFALVAYAYTPAWLGGIFQIIPALSFIGLLAGLYGLYLLYIGLPFMLKTPQEKNTSYFVVAMLCTIGVYIAISIVLGAVFLSFLD
jgi:hypothetical protein